MHGYFEPSRAAARDRARVEQRPPGFVFAKVRIRWFCGLGVMTALKKRRAAIRARKM